MSLSKLTTTLNKISTLDTVIKGQAATVKAAFDYDVNIVKDYINNTLTAETDAAVAQKSTDLNTHKTSGDHDGRYYTETELNLTTDGNSGADKIGVTAIPTLSGSTVQTVLESAKARFDDIATINVNVEVSNTHIGADGRTYATLPVRLDTVDTELDEIAFQNVKNLSVIGDGTTDDIIAINNAAINHRQLYFPSGTYLMNNNFIFPSNTHIIGDGVSTILMFGADFVGTLSTEFAGMNENFEAGKTSSSTVDENIIFENVMFAFQDGSIARKPISLCGVDGATFKNVYIKGDNNQTNAIVPIDLYGANKNILIEKCTFDLTNEATAGGLWVRNYNNLVSTENIRINENVFINKKGDEVLAIWGWQGTVRNVVVDKCTFYNQESLLNNCVALVSICLSEGEITKDITISKCAFYLDVIKSFLIKTANITGCENINIIDNSIYITKELATTNAVISAVTDNTIIKNNYIKCGVDVTKPVIAGATNKSMIEGNTIIVGHYNCYPFYGCYTVKNNKIYCGKAGFNVTEFIDNTINIILPTTAPATLTTYFQYYGLTGTIRLIGNTFINTSGQACKIAILLEAVSSFTVKNNDFGNLAINLPIVSLITEIDYIDNKNSVVYDGIISTFTKFIGNNYNYKATEPSGSAFLASLPIGTIIYDTSGTHMGWAKYTTGNTIAAWKVLDFYTAV